MTSIATLKPQLCEVLTFSSMISLRLAKYKKSSMSSNQGPTQWGGQLKTFGRD